jgi:hypothetical protein
VAHIYLMLTNVELPLVEAPRFSVVIMRLTILGFSPGSSPRVRQPGAPFKAFFWP